MIGTSVGTNLVVEDQAFISLAVNCRMLATTSVLRAMPTRRFGMSVKSIDRRIPIRPRATFGARASAATFPRNLAMLSGRRSRPLAARPAAHWLTDVVIDLVLNVVIERSLRLLTKRQNRYRSSASEPPQQPKQTVRLPWSLASTPWSPFAEPRLVNASSSRSR